MAFKKNRGFTLIELMIVIAIIAIVMAYALPAYRDYTVRAKVGEGLSMTGALKSTISEVWISTSVLTGVNNNTNGIGAASDYQGTNVDFIEVNDGVIKVTFKLDPTLAGETLTLNPVVSGPGGSDGSLIWECSSSIANRYLPLTCRTP